MSITINTAKILKGDKVEISYTRQTPKFKPSKVSEEHADAPHPDFKKAFEDLRIHAAIIAEFISADDVVVSPEITDHAELKNFTVTGFSVYGEDEGVNITAMKTLKNGKMMLFNCPLIRYNDLSDNAYPFAEELQDAINKARTEAKEYLGGKLAADAQLSMFEDQPKKEKSTVIKVLPPENGFETPGPAEIEKTVNRIKGIPPADPEAQARVKAELVTKTGFKRVKQTPENRSGLVKE